MKKQILLSLRVLVCAAIVIGGSACVLWVTGALRDPTTNHSTDYSLVAMSGAGIWGMAFLMWFATRSKPADRTAEVHLRDTHV